MKNHQIHPLHSRWLTRTPASHQKPDPKRKKQLEKTL
jgi:hypothetical protein